MSGEPTAPENVTTNIRPTAEMYRLGQIEGMMNNKMPILESVSRIRGFVNAGGLAREPNYQQDEANLKAELDKEYPGLVLDIVDGPGTPRSLATSIDGERLAVVAELMGLKKPVLLEQMRAIGVDTANMPAAKIVETVLAEQKKQQSSA